MCVWAVCDGLYIQIYKGESRDDQGDSPSNSCYLNRFRARQVCLYISSISVLSL